jgi:RNA polymerase sigma-70 factor, ECF subfamily
MNKLGDYTSSFSEEALNHVDALYRYALALTRAQTEAEDLVQETYLRAVRAQGQLNPGSNLKSWLFVIMRNAWLNQLRHTRNGPHFVAYEGDDNGSNQGRRDDDPLVLYMRKVEGQEIREAISALPDIYREIIVLRDIEGFSYQEIAALLECPAGTVMSRLGRARQKLRRSLTGRQPRAAARGL